VRCQPWFYLRPVAYSLFGLSETPSVGCEAGCPRHGAPNSPVETYSRTRAPPGPGSPQPGWIPTDVRSSPKTRPDQTPTCGLDFIQSVTLSKIKDRRLFILEMPTYLARRPIKRFLVRFFGRSDNNNAPQTLRLAPCARRIRSLAENSAPVYPRFSYFAVCYCCRRLWRLSSCPLL